MASPQPKKGKEDPSLSLPAGAQFFRLSEKKEEEKERGRKCEQGLILFPLFEKKGRKIRGKVSGFFVEFRIIPGADGNVGLNQFVTGLLFV